MSQTDSSHGSEKKIIKRRIKWIRPDLQRKVVVRTVAIAFTALVINFQFALLGVWLMVKDAPPTDVLLLQNVAWILAEVFVAATLVAVGLSIFCGIYYSFKFAGPIYRISCFIRDLKEGPWDVRCGLRSGDDLHDIKDGLNDAVSAFTKRVQSQHALLKEAEALLESGAASVDASRAEALLLKIAAENCESERRLGKRLLERVEPTETIAEEPAESEAEAEPAEESAAAAV